MLQKSEAVDSSRIVDSHKGWAEGKVRFFGRENSMCRPLRRENFRNMRHLWLQMRKRQGPRENWRLSRPGKVLSLELTHAFRVVMRSLDLILGPVESTKTFLEGKGS